MEKLDINTVAGWTKCAEITNKKSFISKMGREPRDKAEVAAWVNAAVARAGALHPAPDYQPGHTLEIIGREKFWVMRF